MATMYQVPAMIASLTEEIRAQGAQQAPVSPATAGTVVKKVLDSRDFSNFTSFEGAEGNCAELSYQFRPIEDRWPSSAPDLVIGVPWRVSDDDEDVDGEAPKAVR